MMGRYTPDSTVSCILNLVMWSLATSLLDYNGQWEWHHKDTVKRKRTDLLSTANFALLEVGWTSTKWGLVPTFIKDPS